MRMGNKLLSAVVLLVMFFAIIQIPQAGGALALDEGQNAVGLPCDAAQRLKDAVVLYVDSSHAYVNNTETQVDASNPEVKPIIKNSRTLVPARFIAESLGAKVEWSAKTSTVTITFENRIVKLVIGSNQMKVGKSEVTLDVAAEILNNRTYVPLRKLVEALGKKVFYDRGLIIVSSKDNLFNTVTEKTLIDGVISKVNDLPVVGSYKVLTDLLKNSSAGNAAHGGPMLFTRNGTAFKTMAQDESAQKADSAAAAPGDYSTTNVQVEGVDEADIVKTDGEYIYQVNKQSIVVARAYPAENMEVLSILKFSDSKFTPQELYLYGQRLVVIGSSYDDVPVYRDESKDTREVCPPDYYSRSTVETIIFDVSDKTNIRQIREVEQEGGYVSSRMIGPSLYIVSNRNLYYYPVLYKEGYKIMYGNTADGSGEAACDNKPSYHDSIEKDGFTSIDYRHIALYPDRSLRYFLFSSP